MEGLAQEQKGLDWCRQEGPGRMSLSRKERPACLAWEPHYSRSKRNVAQGHYGWVKAGKEVDARAEHSPGANHS